MEKLKTPKSIYGLSKLINELMMEKAEQDFGLRWISLRYGNVCGADPKGRIGEAKPKPHTLMTLAIYSIMARQGYFDSVGWREFTRRLHMISNPVPRLHL